MVLVGLLVIFITLIIKIITIFITEIIIFIFKINLIDALMSFLAAGKGTTLPVWVWVGGGLIWSCSSPGIFGCSFMYETQGIYQFLSNVSFLPPYLGSENLKNHYIRVKNQSCRKLYIWVSKPIRRKIQNQWKKLELNRAYQLREKSKKPPENTVFQKSDISGGFLDFSLNW